MGSLYIEDGIGRSVRIKDALAGEVTVPRVDARDVAIELLRRSDDAGDQAIAELLQAKRRHPERSIAQLFYGSGDYDGAEHEPTDVELADDLRRNC